MTDKVRVWDGFVRLFHWSLVALIACVWLTADGPKVLHEGLGYVIAGLIAPRVIWGLIGPRHARFWPICAICGRAGNAAIWATIRRAVRWSRRCC
ncbi:hypothetical protein [Paracoccus sp. T5]|uniref:hypothetical protein n=1 Tax=Paracoccus sp. T5 TaxID=3402161 RepID=UPI003AD92BF9